MPTDPSPSILLVTPGRDPVGTGRETELLAEDMRAAGRTVHVAVMSRGGAVPDRLAAQGIPVHRLGRRPEVDVAAAARLTMLARRLRPAVVIVAGRSLLAAAAAVKLARPQTHVVARLAATVVRPLHTRALRQIDLVLATSPVVAASCRSDWSGPRVEIVAPGITADPGRGLDRAAIASHLGLDPAKIWTLCVAPLVAASKLERLIWAIDQLGVVHKGLEHVLVGSGPLLPRVRRRARVQELADRLVVLPHCDLLPDLLGQVRLVWQSGQVAFGGALLDAMASGVPTVAVESEAARQLIVDGETGRIVPAIPESEFPRRAFGIIEDDALAARYGAAGRARAETEFAADRMVAGVLAALDAA
ncbi:MAG: putative glycosyltransferase EpsD [Planctomycetota bacterium]